MSVYVVYQKNLTNNAALTFEIPYALQIDRLVTT